MSIVEKIGDSRLQQVCRSGDSGFAVSPVGRLIVSPAGPGTMNMAIDDALLASAAPELGPTLRFYRWCEPTLSLGYFQSVACRSEHAASSDLPLVRRASGGGAIVHDRELTYSLILPSVNKSDRSAALDVYRTVHGAFIDSLREWGISAQRFGETGQEAKPGEPFLCFQRRNNDDLVISGYKVLGSAQRRGPSGVLQHGSLLLASSEAAPELPGIHELTSRSVDIDSLIDQLATKLAAVCGVSWIAGDVTIGELSSSKAILMEKYSSVQWTTKR